MHAFHALLHRTVSSRFIPCVLTCVAYASILSAVEGPKYACAISDYKKSEVCLISKTGDITARYKAGRTNDVWVLPDGAIAFGYYAGMKVIDPSGNERFSWTVPKKVKDEIHAIQPLPDGGFMIARNGLSCLIEINNKGETVKTIPVPSKIDDMHGRYRTVRKLLNGNYLCALKKDKELREVDAEGKTVRSISTAPMAPHGVIRLPNGNTLFSVKGKPSSYIREIDQQDNEVWSLQLNSLPGAKLKDVIGLQRLKNGNTVLAGYLSNYQIVEVTPSKEVVWKWNVPGQISVSAIHVFEGEGDCTTGEVLR